MTGKSKYSDKNQRAVVEKLLKGYDIVDIAKTLNMEYPYPSQRTLSRWIDVWKPVILKEIKARQDEQDKARKDKIPQHEKKVRQDENYLKIPLIFLSVVEAMAYNWLESYKSKSNPATIRRRAKVKKIISILIKEVDK